MKRPAPQELYCVHLMGIHHKFPEVPMATLQAIDRLLNEANARADKLERKTIMERVRDCKDLLDTLEDEYYSSRYN